MLIVRAKSSYRKWEWQLTPESLERQAAFYHSILGGPDTRAARSVEFWPKVRLHVTEKHYAGSWRGEDAYPLPSTVRTKYFLTEAGTLSNDSARSDKLQGAVSYNAVTGSLSWKVTFDKPTEITGSAKLHLDFSVSEGNGASIFVTLQKLDRDGRVVEFPYHSFINDGHVAYGWLQASKRARDPHSWGDEVAHTFLEKDVSFLVPNSRSAWI